VPLPVTLRKENMFSFLAKTLIEILPKIKDFNGLPLTRKIKKTYFLMNFMKLLVFMS
jgi:ribosomal protein L5